MFSWILRTLPYPQNINHDKFQALNYNGIYVVKWLFQGLAPQL